MAVARIFDGRNERKNEKLDNAAWIFNNIPDSRLETFIRGSRLAFRRGTFSGNDKTAATGSLCSESVGGSLPRHRIFSTETRRAISFCPPRLHRRRRLVSSGFFRSTGPRDSPEFSRSRCIFHGIKDGGRRATRIAVSTGESLYI